MESAQGNTGQLQSVASLLRNTSHAMQDLHELIQDIELKLLGGTVGTHPTPTGNRTLQTVDLLSQSIHEIETLLLRLSSTLPPTNMIMRSDIIEPIRLEHLRRIIAEGLGEEPRKTEVSTGASIVLF